jgi:hypothetical protein
MMGEEGEKGMWLIYKHIGVLSACTGLRKKRKEWREKEKKGGEKVCGGGEGGWILDPGKFFWEPLASVSTRMGRRKRERKNPPNPFERMMGKNLERN